MDRIPLRGVEAAERFEAPRADQPILHRPGERARVDGQRVVQRAQAAADRRHRGCGIGLPPVGDRVLARETGGDDPRAVLVGAAVQHPRHPHVARGPLEAHHLSAQVDAARGRDPLGELAPGTGSHLVGLAAQLVVPHEGEPPARREPFDRGRDGWRLGPAPPRSSGRDHPGAIIRGLRGQPSGSMRSGRYSGWSSRYRDALRKCSSLCRLTNSYASGSMLAVSSKCSSVRFGPSGSSRT